MFEMKDACSVASSPRREIVSRTVRKQVAASVRIIGIVGVVHKGKPGIGVE